MIELRDVTFSYPRRISLLEVRRRRSVFRNLNMKFHDGINLLISPNGSGKTTLLKIIGGIIEPDSGQVLLDGEPSNYLERLIRVSYIPVISSLPSRITVKDLLSFLGGRDAFKEVFPLVSDILDRQLLTLSSGQYKRAFIAAGLMKRSRYLVMDEPFHFLDDESRERLIHHLVSAKYDMTIVLTGPSKDVFKGIAPYSRVIDPLSQRGND